ncbi:MAG: hypothetical protein NT062_17295 [Proteobacteria bacterium]|nr:hypothetical protein [Pseudomonadota bacterium]
MAGLVLVVTAHSIGCAGEASPSDPYADHEELSDLEPGDGKADGLDSFNMNDVYDDAFLTDANAIDVTNLQAFFETTPYGNRSWLADATINGVTAAEAIVAAAQAESINPLVLVARMCPDGGGCSASYRGLDKQFACAAQVLRKWYDASIDGTGQYRMGHSTRTLDPKTVTPKNHATASLYAYTPWVLVGSGGTWLVWNVTKKYVRYATAAGLLTSSPT